MSGTREPSPARSSSFIGASFSRPKNSTACKRKRKLLSPNSYLGLELDLEPLQDLRARLIHELEHVCGGGVAPIDDEAGVDGGDLRATHTGSFETCSVDEAPSVIARRVLEHGATGELIDGLSLPAIRQEAAHALADLLGIRGLRAEVGLEQHDVRGDLERAVTKAELLGAHLLAFPRGRVQELDALDHVPHLSLRDSRVHCEPTSHRAGNADRELEPCESLIGTEARDTRMGRAGLCQDPPVVAARQFAQPV
jgi:hypothetical protein